MDNLKKDFNSLINDNDVENFAYIVDKKNNSLICVNNIDITSLTLTNPQQYNLDAVIDENKISNNKIQQLKKDIEINNVVISCAQTLLEKNSFEVSINKLLDVLCTFYGGEFACLFERNYETNMTNVNYKFHKIDTTLINKRYTESFKISAEDTWTRYLRENDYAFLQSSNDIDPSLADTSYYQRFMSSERTNLLVVSLNDNDTILGGIEIDNITKNTEHVGLIKTISAFIVNNLHIKNAHEDLHKNITDLENKNALNYTMLECVKTLVDDETITIAMNKLLEIINNYYGADITNIYYNKPNNDTLTRQHSFALSHEIDSSRVNEIPMGEILNLFNSFDIGGVGYISSIREMGDMLDSNFTKIYDVFLEKKINSLLFVPLITHNKIVGFLDVENPKRNLNEAFLVKTLSTFVINHINKNELLQKLEKLSYSDSLTGLYNRNFYNNYIDEFNSNPTQSVGIIFADVNGLKKANDNFGHELGDKLIKWSANFFAQNVTGLNFRIGGDEFVSIIEDITPQDFDSLVTQLKQKLDSYGEVHISIGKAHSHSPKTLDPIITQADQDMYSQKQLHYKKLSQDERSIKQSLHSFRTSIENL